MARIWSSGRERSRRAWLTSAGERPATGFPLADLAGVRAMLAMVRRSFGLILTVRSMLLRRGPSFRPGRFSLPVWLSQRERRACGLQIADG